MYRSEKEFFSLFGWDGFFQNQCPDLVSSSLTPARVKSAGAMPIILLTKADKKINVTFHTKDKLYA